MIRYDDTTGESQEYADFVEKFKPKKTTDDCYTPANVYEAVLSWAVKEYHLEGRPVLRPFYPGGDYLAEDYPPEAVVIDNPPFSILSQICDYYDFVGVDYFLFAPALTLFSTNAGRDNYVLSSSNITYANGACVRTGFITNLGTVKVLAAPDLHRVLLAAEKENTAGKELPKYSYPTSVITPATFQKLASRGVRLELMPDELIFVRTLDSQREYKKSIFGAGFILSESAEARHIAALEESRAYISADPDYDPEGGIVWKLSEREMGLRGK